MMHLPLRDGVLERAHDVLLADHLRERARAVATVKRGADGHGDSSLVVTGAVSGARSMRPPARAVAAG